MKGFTIYGRGGHLCHVTQMSRTNFRTNRGSTQNLALIGRRRCLKLLTDGRRQSMGIL